MTKMAKNKMSKRRSYYCWHKQSKRQSSEPIEKNDGISGMARISMP